MSTRRIARALAAVALAMTVGLVAPTTGAEAVTAQEYAVDVRNQTNKERTSRGLSSLSYYSCLKTYSERQAKAMAKAKRIYHQQLGPILTACKLSRVGENVAMGYPSGYRTVKGWMGSPGHRANILNSQFKVMAVSAAKGSDGRWYVAQVLGTRR
ncbi:hypothetical protein GC722_15390 [Auraticoccus sp. F435]|uniref:SCP domain-containing protein n=1 Tax=Auraticoccus cholistanensis TaxID=2656650 RepID=A0A6A9UZG3_9ACTN|nr:CAP domain-containing protein [Auraticoccus cholistanensis]MVA77394.1 hypothetical protein [Auraticoccus cholistanensis]